MRRLIATLLLVATVAACSSGERSTEVPEDDASVLGIQVRELDLSFAVIGDWGSGLAGEFAVADRMCRWLDKHPYEYVFTTGDNIYPDGAPSDFREKFFEPHACTLEAGVQWHASLGNHDVATRGGQPELDEPRFGMKGRNYVVRKQGVRFVVWDSNRMPMRWLRRNVSSQPGDVWTVVVFHHPVVSAGTGHGPTPDLAGKVVELFSREGVDLVLNGHDHVLSVSKPIGGVRYVVTGGGGASIVGCRDAMTVKVCEARHHFLYVTADEEQMRVHAIPAKGRQLHSFKITQSD